MLTLPSSTLIFLARDRIDGRKGIDSLVAVVRSQFGRDPLRGHLFVFLSRRGDRVRVPFWDRNGYALALKRLENGTFKPIAFDATHSEIEHDELPALLGGLDLSAARRRPRWTPQRSVARTCNRPGLEFALCAARLPIEMAKRATAEEQPAIEQPPLDSQDASAIRSFIEA